MLVDITDVARNELHDRLIGAGDHAECTLARVTDKSRPLQLRLIAFDDDLVRFPAPDVLALYWHLVVVEPAIERDRGPLGIKCQHELALARDLAVFARGPAQVQWLSADT